MNINIPNKKFVKDNIDDFRAFLTTRFDQATDKRNDKARRYDVAYKMYNNLLPLKDKVNRASGYVAPVVRNIVDKVMPSQLNIFTENDTQAVVFRPQKTMLSSAVIDAVNTHINQIFLRENNGYNVLSNTFREALISGDAFVKVFIEEEEVIEEVDFTGNPLPVEAFMMILEKFPETDIAAIDFTEKTMFDEATQMEAKATVVEGPVVLKRIDKHYRLAFVPFDEMFVLGDTQDIADTRYLCHRMTKTVGELVEMGFDREKVMTASDSDETQDLSTKDLTNTNVVGSIGIGGSTFAGDDLHRTFQDPMEREVYLYEHFIRSSLLDKKGKSTLYQVFAVNKSCILEVNEVPRIPFVHGVPGNIPGSFWGEGMADKFGEHQNLISGIIRDIADKSALSVTPRYQAVKGAYDRQSLLNNRPGAVIEVQQVGAVNYFPETPMPQEAMAVLAQLQQDVNDATMNNVGVNLDPAALQNVAATAVAMSVHNAEMKDKVIAKTFAQTLIRPMFELLYHTLRDNDAIIEIETMVPPTPKMMEQGITDPHQEVIPFGCSQLPSRSEFYIDVNTANDDALQTSTIASVATFIAQMSTVQSNIVGPQQLYNAAKAMLHNADIHNVEDYLIDPSTVQQDPQMLAAELQQAQEVSQLQKDQVRAQVGAQMALQVKAETETMELVANGKHKREMEQAQMLLAYEEMELKRKSIEAKIEYDETRNELRAEELHVESTTGQTIGLSM